MKRRRGRWRAPIAAALVLTLLGLTSAAGQEPGEPAPEPTIAVESDAARDAAIRQRIQGIFREIDGLRDVTVVVDAGVVTLGGRVLEAEAAARAERLASRVADVAAVNNEIMQETAISLRLEPVLERTEQRLYRLFGALPLLAVAILVFALVVVLGIVIARLARPWDRIAPNEFIANLLRQVVRLVFVALGLVVALDILGATALIGTLLGAAGLVGLAVGFAVRDTIENFVASVVLSLRQPFRPNDLVLIEGIEGYVTAMNSRATILTTLESNHVRIPNSTVFKATIVNYTRNPERRFDFRVGVETDDLRRAVDLGLETITQLHFVLDEPTPLGFIERVDDSAITLYFAAWVDQRVTSFPKARGEAIRMVLLAFAEAGIGVPEPIHRLRFDAGAGELHISAKEAERPASRRLGTGATMPGDVSPEPVVAERVEAERAHTRDLLSPEAPQEIEGP